MARSASNEYSSISSMFSEASMKISPEVTSARYSMPSLTHLLLHLYITKVLKIL